MLLEVHSLEVHYGGIRAVSGVDLVIGEGELVCLIGANGAGKSSTLKAISGLVTTKSGSVRYRGEDISHAPVHELPRKGLVMVPEGRGIFAQLTVEENLAMGAYAHGGGNPAAQYERFPRLAERRRQIAGTLSGGEQQMLALGRALMSEPQLLCMDEPSLGLAPMVVQEIFKSIRAANAAGTSVLLVEQNARYALETASRGYVLQTGRIIAAASCAELKQDPRVKEAYLGRR